LAATRHNRLVVGDSPQFLGNQARGRHLPLTLRHAPVQAREFKGKKVEVSLFKGLGEMNPNQLKQTTMDPKTRSMLKITLPSAYEDRQPVKDLVERLTGRDPAPRFEFIQSRASAVDEEEIDA
jgi:topoisomerase IV subunit B